MIKGRVVHGRGIGANLGYPTANILPEEEPRLESGVYVAKVRIGNREHPGVLVVGAIADVVPYSLEVHVLHFTGDLYGQELAVEVFEKVSGLEWFDNDEQLVAKIQADIAKVREILK